MTIEELFGTLQMSVVAGWRKHLRTAKYGKHKALQEFYEEMPEKVDALIEGWMGANGKKIGAFQNVLSSSNMNTLKYLGELKRVCKEGKALMNENEELLSLVDDILNLINSTLYKVKELSESSMMDFKDFVLERLDVVNEGKGDIILSPNKFAHIVKGSEWEDLDKSEQNDVVDTLSDLYNQHSYELVNKDKSVRLTFSKKDGIIIKGVKKGNYTQFAGMFIGWMTSDCGYELYRDDVYALFGEFVDMDILDELCDENNID